MRVRGLKVYKPKNLWFENFKTTHIPVIYTILYVSDFKWTAVHCKTPMCMECFIQLKI